MSDPEIVSIVVAPAIFPDLKVVFERRFPGLMLYRLPPAAETPGEHVYSIGLRT